MARLLGSLVRTIGRTVGIGGHPAPVTTSASEEAISEAERLIKAAIQDLQQASAELHAPRGVVGATTSLATTAYNSATDKEGGPTLKDAGQTLKHDGRYPAKPLVEQAMEKYILAQQYVTDLPDIESAVVKVSRRKAAGRGLSVAGLVVGFGPIGLAVKAGRRRRAKRSVDAMLEEMQEVLDALQQARRPLMQAEQL